MHWIGLDLGGAGVLAGVAAASIARRRPAPEHDNVHVPVPHIVGSMKRAKASLGTVTISSMLAHARLRGA